MKRLRIALLASALGVGLGCSPPTEEPLPPAPPSPPAQTAESAFLEALQQSHPELDYEANGYPVFTLDAQREAAERYLDQVRERRVEGLREQTPPREWIAVSHHGDILDANLELINCDEGTITRIQDSMLELFLDGADPEALEELGFDVQEAYFGSDLEGPLLLALRSGILRGLLELAEPAVVETFGWRLRILHERLFMLPEWNELVPETVATGVLLPEPLARFATPLPYSSTYYLPTRGTKSHNADCDAQDVPTPPDWPNPAWKRQGELPIGLNFAGGRGKVEVYAYEETGVAGTCIALPRWVDLVQPDGTRKSGIGALGIICQSAKTGRACFWDNRRIKPGTLWVETIQGTSITLDMDEIRNGSNLATNCTDCHRGENVFLVHPGTAIDLGRPQTGLPQGYNLSPGSSGWYTPMGQTDWKNPGPVKMPKPLFSSSCVNCHLLPEVRRLGYCSTVLGKAAAQTMPSIAGASAAGWPAPLRSTHFEHVRYLYDLCHRAHP